MRHAAAPLGLSVALGVGLGLSVVLAASGAEAMGGLVTPPASHALDGQPLVRVGYYCSPGFEATYGGRCVATASTDQVDLQFNEPSDYGEPAPVVHRHHRHKRLHERY